MTHVAIILALATTVIAVFVNGLRIALLMNQLHGEPNFEHEDEA